MGRKKLCLEPGKKYKGVGWVNEYGQSFFEAYQKSESPNSMKLIKETEVFSLYESGNFLKVAVKIEKNAEKFEMIRTFMNAFQLACVELKNYDTNSLQKKKK